MPKGIPKRGFRIRRQPWRSRFPRDYFVEKGRQGGNPFMRAMKGRHFSEIKSLADILGE
jgi:hypothetical protein